MQEAVCADQIIIKSIDFTEGNLNRFGHSFGDDVVIDGGFGESYARYEFDVHTEDKYNLFSRYLSPDLRPVDIYLDGVLVKKWAMSQRSPSMETKDMLSLLESEGICLSSGMHVLEIKCIGVLPHIESFVFKPSAKDEASDAVHNTSCNKTEELKKASVKIPLYRRFRNDLKRLGVRETLAKTRRYFTKEALYEQYGRILGIFSGNLAFYGPRLVQIDVTYNCNNNCIGCWCHSELLGEKKMPEDIKKYTLPFDMVINLIDQLYELGTREIYFAGGGEPFMHPQFMDIVEYVKSKDMICFINTNFTLVTENDLKRMIVAGVDHLTVSVWAGTAETYVRTHPNKTVSDFNQLKSNLMLLNANKHIAPHVKLYQVISKENYHEIDKMVQFAIDTNSEAIEFTLIDTIPGKTDVLLLDESQHKELVRQCLKLKKDNETTDLGSKIILFGFDQFMARISHEGSLVGEHDKGIIDKIPCYIGWLFARINADGDVNSCLKSHRLPVGNLYRDSFKNIWNGEKQCAFRKKTSKGDYSDPIFAQIGNDPDKKVGCYKSCDDIARNRHMMEKIQSLHFFEIWLVKLAAVIFKMRYKKHICQNHNKSKEQISSKNKELIKNNLDVAGALNGSEAFSGPEHVVLDITNACDNTCIGCWTKSPLLKDKRPPEKWHRQSLGTDILKKLIDDLSSLGTKRIRFTGGGEPLLHPDVFELINYVKSKNIICSVTTNALSLNEEKVKRLIDADIDELSVSLWAGSPQAYMAGHPGKTADDYERIVKNLKLFASKRNAEKTTITLCNVISVVNYDDVVNMYNLAKEISAQGIYLTLIDVIEGATDSLLLNNAQQKELLKQLDAIETENNSLSEIKKIHLDNFEGLKLRLADQQAVAKGDYDKKTIDDFPCYIGWIFARITADGFVSPCCRGVNKPMGNITEKTFAEIWDSDEYREFRQKAKELSKSDDYFKDFSCHKTCDNKMHNIPFHHRIQALSKADIDVLTSYNGEAE